MCMEQKREVKKMIECNSLSKIYLDRATKTENHVVEKIDLSVNENEFLVLFGPGQCGKTTILNMLAGLETPTSGEIEVNGKKVEGPDPERGVVYQSISLFPWLTTMGNVEYGPKMRRIKKEERQKRAQYYIDLVGLSGFERSYPIQLSGGMKQRVGIARAYCNNPVVMFMDEPFGALDAQTRYLMQEELEKICQKEKKTVVFVTNNIEEAIYLADRIVVLRNCPTSIKAEYKITLPRPRDNTSPEFLALRKEISSIVDITL
ncbi:nitrate ABC transporter ATP-binding protein [Claveliimonas bilis]|nr:nitrate ABC transporter ATP-binding protein [Claveliimonas bilis]